MVVSENEPRRADERTRTAVVEAQTCQTDVIEPLTGQREVVALFQLPGRRIVEGPHPLIRRGGRGNQERGAADQHDSRG